LEVYANFHFPGVDSGTEGVDSGTEGVASGTEGVILLRVGVKIPNIIQIFVSYLMKYKRISAIRSDLNLEP
jgi:hypothetical protein